MSSKDHARNRTPEEHSKLLERLEHYLDGEQADLGKIRVTAAISKAVDSGVAREEIIDTIGGYEEVERLIGSAAAKELLEEDDEEN